MSSPDPFDKRRLELAAAKGIDPFEMRMQEITQAPIDEETQGAWDRFLEGAVNMGETVGWVVNPFSAFQEEGQGQLSMFGAGLVGGGLLDPAIGVAGLPGAFGVAEELSEKAVNFLTRAQENIYSMAEVQALEAGMTDNEIADAYAVGNFVGFIAPVTASIKAAGLAMRVAPVTMAEYVTSGTIINEAVAGAIYGSVFMEGETLEERGKNLLHESAMFGVGRAVLSSTVKVFGGYRRKRARELLAHETISKRLTDMENGLDVRFETVEEVEGLMQILSEENYISNSFAAQKIFERNGDETALVQGIMDLHATKATGGIIRDLRRNFDDVAEITDKFKAEFPGLKFTEIKNKSGGYDVYFGTKGLSNKQKSQLKKRGNFEGQVMQHQGGETYSLVGPAKRKEYLVVKRADGTTMEVKAANVTELPRYEEEFIPTPEIDALYKSFASTVDAGMVKAASMRGGISELDLIKAVRSGQIKITDDGRRAFDVGGAIIYPEELGLRTGEEGISGVVLRKMEVFDDMRTGQVTEPQMVRGLVHKNASFGSHPSEKAWRLTVLDDTYTPLGHQSFDTFGQAIKYAEADKWIPAEVTLNFGSAQKALVSISKDGKQFTQLLDPPPVVTLDNAVEAWAKQKGIPLDAPDMPAMKAHFAGRYRKEMWDAVPAEDRAMFERIRGEMEDLVESGIVPFEAVAHNKGFSVRKISGGGVELREINTGAKLRFANEDLALVALKKVVRNEEDMLGGFLGMDSNGMGSYTGGFRGTDGEFNFDGRVLAKDFVENIPQNTFRNQRDWMVKLEKLTGFQFFTKIFEPLDQGLSKVRNQYEPIAKELENLADMLPLKQRQEVVEKLWLEVEGTDMSIKEVLALGREKGLSSKQLAFFSRARVILREWGEQSGLPLERLINFYYGRVQPWASANSGIIDIAKMYPDGVPGEFQAFFRMMRTGELGAVETDPIIMMHKWIRAALWEKEVKPFWDQAARLVEGKNTPPLMVKNLTREQQLQFFKNAAPGTNLDSPVIPDPIRRVLSEYLTNIRGNPNSGLESLRNFSRKLFKGLGVKADDRVLEEYYNIMMSNMYGAAMGIRPALIARNDMQVIWGNYPRLGGKFMHKAQARAITQEGFDEAVDQGVIRLTEAGLPFSNAAFTQLIQPSNVQGTGPMSKAIAAGVRGSLRIGGISRNAARKILVPYSTGDDLGRAWAYHWQKMHTGEKLNLFEGKKISWDKFLEDGLPMFSPVIKKEFSRIYDIMGREDALRYIGKMNADEQLYIYGAGAAPAWMQRPLGRLFSMFGTHPLWTMETYFNRAFAGTKKQNAMFWARSIAVTGIVSNMALQTGVDMWSWMNPLSVFGWAGGPWVDNVINARRIATAPMDQKASAFKRFAGQAVSLQVPGQLFLNDFRESLNMENPRDAAMRMMLGRPSDDSHFSMKFLYDPEDMGTSILQDSANEAAFENPFREGMTNPILIRQLQEGLGTPSSGGGEERMQFRGPSTGPDLSTLRGNMPTVGSRTRSP